MHALSRSNSQTHWGNSHYLHSCTVTVPCESAQQLTESCTLLAQIVLQHVQRLMLFAQRLAGLHQLKLEPARYETDSSPKVSHAPTSSLISIRLSGTTCAQKHEQSLQWQLHPQKVLSILLWAIHSQLAYGGQCRHSSASI